MFRAQSDIVLPGGKLTAVSTGRSLSLLDRRSDAFPQVRDLSLLSPVPVRESLTQFILHLRHVEPVPGIESGIFVGAAIVSVANVGRPPVEVGEVNVSGALPNQSLHGGHKLLSFS